MIDRAELFVGDIETGLLFFFFFPLLTSGGLVSSLRGELLIGFAFES